MPDSNVDPNTEPIEPVVVPVDPNTEPTEPVVAPVDPTEPIEPVEPKKQTAQERIDEITKARREAERDAEYWKNLAISKEESPPIKPVVPTETTGRPNQGNFETVEEYEDALIGWHDQKRSVAAGVVEQQKRQQEALKTFNDNAVEARKKYSNFDEVVNRPVFTDVMRSIVLTSKIGTDLAHHLGTNTEIAKKIAQMPVEIQSYEMGKLEMKLKITQKTKTTTTAPDPITPVGDVSALSADESKMNDEDWFKMDQARRKEKIQQKYKGE